MRELAVIIPVYNEEGAIGAVLSKWTKALDAMEIDYQIHAYNDGSKDNTLAILQQAAASHERIIVHDKPNSGHGPTILEGYRQNCETAEWLFQIDSDDEMGPESFAELWNRRNDYDFLLGRRDGRKQALPRKIISFISRLSVRMLYGKTVWDVNAPYRLMRSDSFREVYHQIPEDTFAPNVIISGMAGHNNLRLFEVPVPQKDRTTGEVSIKKWKLAKAAMKSFRQTVAFALENNSEENDGPYKFKKSHLLGYALLVCLFLFLIFTSTFNPIRPFRYIESDIFLYNGFIVANGGIPYIDCFDHKGPMIFLFDALGYKIAGNTGCWLIQSLFLFVSFVYAFRLMRIIVGFWITIFSMCLAFIVFPFGDNTIEHFAIPFIFMSLYYLYLYIKKDSKLEWYRIVLSGIGLGIVFFLRPNMIGLWVVFCSYVLIICLINKAYTLLLKQIVQFVFGFTILVLPICLYLYVNGAWNEFIYQYFTFNFMYFSEPSIVYTREEIKGFIVFVYIILLFISSILLYISLVNSKNIKSGHFIYRYCMLLSFACPLCLYLAFSGGKLFYYYISQLTPFAFIAITFSLYFMILSNANKNKLIKFHRCTKFLCLYIIIAVIVIFPFSIKWRINFTRSDYPQSLVQWINKNVPKSSSVINFDRLPRVFLDTQIISKTKYMFFPIISTIPEKIAKEYQCDLLNSDFDFIMIYKGGLGFCYGQDKKNIFDNIVIPVLTERCCKIVYEDNKYIIYKSDKNI